MRLLKADDSTRIFVFQYEDILKSFDEFSHFIFSIYLGTYHLA